VKRQPVSNSKSLEGGMNEYYISRICCKMIEKGFRASFRGGKKFVEHHVIRVYIDFEVLEF